MAQDEAARLKPRLLTTLTVGRRTYRKLSRKDRRRRLEYSHPELRLSNRWLAEAGIQPGDRVFVVYVRPGRLVIGSAPAQTSGDAESANRATPPSCANTTTATRA
jgi:hypothetical protein